MATSTLNPNTVNYLLIPVVLAFYAAFNANKAKATFMQWIVENKMTMIAAALVLLVVVSMPKILTGAATMVYILPLLSSWGIISMISNVFTAIEALFKNKV